MADRDYVIGFDADDTLWHNETIFENVHVRFRALLAAHHDAATVDRTQFANEMKNLELYGYGVKGFTLSAIETAIQLTEGKISAEEIRQLLELGREMLAHPVELLEGVAETLASRDQERKLRKSGLADHFRHVEIVSEKDERTYEGIFRRHAIAAENFMMVGNSLKSDIVPVLALGGSGVHVPYPLTWAHEHVENVPAIEGRFFALKNIRELPAVVAAWARVTG